MTTIYRYFTYIHKYTYINIHSHIHTYVSRYDVYTVLHTWLSLESKN